ncbi:hypothetical protein OnM2_000005 [Erysiphe neolycopersici]|uniref:Uncharacterized protein n=1 Tax=Erysiphe neolycopersici TaxID=212602 RepID=A0A420I8K0_9PEZI|nr:hypothetical protein OnM2_000005 [Erysiphe neolycopersici]
MSVSEQKLTCATLFDYLYEVPGRNYSNSTSTLGLLEDKDRFDSSSDGERSERISAAQPSESLGSNAVVQPAGLIPSDLNDLVIRFFNVIILRVGGDALEVLEQNRRLVECLNDTSAATTDDMATCNNLLITRFGHIIQETMKDWMKDLKCLRQESTEIFESYHSRAIIFLKNLDLADEAKNYSMTE